MDMNTKVLANTLGVTRRRQRPLLPSAHSTYVGAATTSTQRYSVLNKSVVAAGQRKQQSRHDGQHIQSTVALPSTVCGIPSVQQDADALDAIIAPSVLHQNEVSANSASNRVHYVGLCRVCKRNIHLTAAGVLYKHGPGCAGSSVRPVDGSVQESNTNPQQCRLVPGDSPPLAVELTSDIFLDQLRDGMKCRLVKRIPKAARAVAAQKFIQLLTDIIANPDNLQAWFNVLLFPSCCFKVPSARGGRKHQTALAGKLMDAIRMYPDRSVVENVERYRRMTGKSNSQRTDLERMAARVSEMLEDGDVRGAVRLAASDEVMAPYNLDTVNELMNKHPRAVQPPNCIVRDEIDPLQIDEPVIAAAIKSFPAGSAGGLDGLRPQHIKDMVGSQTAGVGQQLISQLTGFSNLVLSGRVPSIVRPVFCGASLCALKKKDGGIRPIAVGCTLRRLVAKAACSTIRDRVTARFVPLQLGFGVKQGAEAAAHAARCYVNNLGPGEALLKIDFANAFNSVDRDEIFSSTADFFPELLSFVNVCYGQPSFLNFGEYLIKSEVGIQQGDPLGPLCYCASTQKLIQNIKTDYMQWYLDDGALGGPVEELMQAFEFIRTEGAKIGLRVNERKCELITNDPSVIHRFQSLAPDVIIVDPASAILLGAPVGSDQSVDLVMQSKLTELKRLGDRLGQLNAHDAFFLLRNCFSLPKLQYTLRCSPCFNSTVIARYDECIRDLLEIIMNVQLNVQSWLQASLPVLAGGLGVRTASHIALPAFLSSVIGSADLCLQLLPSRLHSYVGRQDVHFTAACEIWKTRTPAAPPFDARQKSWDSPLVAAASAQLLTTAPDQVAVARLTAVSAPHAGAFLHAIPITACGTRLDDRAFRIAVALRLGSPVCGEHRCVCGATVDVSGLHGLSCRKSTGRLARHNAVNELIRRALLSAQIPSRLEPAKLSRTDDKRPDGLSTMPWSRGRCVAWDFTCPDTLSASHLNRAVTGPGEVANEAEEKKRSKYAELTTQYEFVPIAVETLGAVGIEATAFFQDLGRRISAVTMEPRTMSFLWQRLSVAVQRGNAACIAGTELWSDRDTLFYDAT